jgi:ectoine hydroxylase-related dioxygenase (phytanoyl-CoA dioxygenase family)
MRASMNAFEDRGYALVPDVLDARQCEVLAGEIEGAGRDRSGSRNLLNLPRCQQLAVSLKAHAGIAAFLEAATVAVQCTLFEKAPQRNWLVALHQDLSIPVAERILHPTCTGWSQKEDVLYVQPPVPVLESLVAVRVHLDDSGPESGPLRVVPHSHRHGRLSVEAANAARCEYGETECVVQRGGALVMRPLLLHASSKARGQSRRRVLHFLFGPAELPHGLRWHRAV